MNSRKKSPARGFVFAAVAGRSALDTESAADRIEKPPRAAIHQDPLANAPELPQ